jgi:hypothetical protein
MEPSSPNFLITSKVAKRTEAPLAKKNAGGKGVHSTNVAVLLTGHMRSWAVCQPSFNEHILVPLEAHGMRTSVFIATWPFINQGSNVKIDVDKIVAWYGDSGKRSVEVRFAKYTDAGRRAHYLEKIFGFVENAVSTVLDRPEVFDFVLKLRPDLRFYSPFPEYLCQARPEGILVPDRVDSRDGGGRHWVLDTFQTNLGIHRVQDHIALATPKAMRIYGAFGTNLRTKKHQLLLLNRPVENLLGEYLHTSGVGVKTSCGFKYGLIR